MIETLYTGNSNFREEFFFSLNFVHADIFDFFGNYLYNIKNKIHNNMKNKHIISSIQKELIKEKKRRQMYSRVFLLLIVLGIIFFISRSHEYQVIILGISLIIGIVVLLLPGERVFISPEEIHKKIEKRIAFLEAEKKKAENELSEIDEEENELKTTLLSMEHGEEKKM